MLRATPAVSQQVSRTSVPHLEEPSFAPTQTSLATASPGLLDERTAHMVARPKQRTRPLGVWPAGHVSAMRVFLRCRVGMICHMVPETNTLP